MSPHQPADTRSMTLHGSWLRCAQGTWLLLVVGALFLFVLSIPPRFIQLSTVSDELGHGLLRQLGWVEHAAFAQVGIPLRVWAGYVVTCEAVAALVCFLVGGFIFWRNAHDGMAMLAALVIGLLGTTSTINLLAFALAHPQWRIPMIVVSVSGAYAFLLFLYLFPTGQFVPHWTRILALVLAPLLLAWSWVLYEMQALWLSLPTLLLPGMYFGSAGVGVYGQILRYRGASTPVQRQQTKWVVFGLTALFCLLIVNGVLGVLAGFELLGSMSWVYYLVIPAAYTLGALVLPMSIGVAILHYRLWEIDVLVNRTLIYSLLTAMLVAIYLTSIVVLQTVLRPLVGTDSEVATVVSTLAIAALFNPLRRRIQAFIDRRFYRRKYDAAKTLQAFSARLRDEVDLNTLRADLTSVVQDTLQPAHVSLWLKPVERGRNG